MVIMSMDFNVLPKVFKALYSLNIEEICSMSTIDIRPILPCLVRMTFTSSTDNWGDCPHQKLTLLAFLSEMYEADSIIGLLAVNFQLLEKEIKEEQISRYLMIKSFEIKLNYFSIYLYLFFLENNLTILTMTVPG